MQQQFVNNLRPLLTASLATNGVTVAVEAGAFAGLPAPSVDAPYVADLVHVVNRVEVAREIVRITAFPTTSSATIVRAQEGTTALAWVAGDRLDFRLTAGTLANFAQRAELPAAAFDLLSPELHP